MNADPVLILLVCAALLVVAIWAASHGESKASDPRDEATLNTRGRDE